MPDFSNEECEMIEKYADSFLEWFKKNLVVKIQSQIGYKMPTEVESILVKLHSLSTLLKKRNAGETPKNRHSLSEEYNALIKKIIIHQRRIVASKLEEPLSKTFHPELIANLERETDPIRRVMETEWFQGTSTLKIPHLTEFLSIKFVEEMHNSSHTLEKRDYDEKFHILQTPSLFPKDLRYYREKCELRSNGLMVAYLDIDDFKKFNTKYGETRIDRDVLPKFMELMESHLFTHGYGYRYGGDEYTILLPNMSLNMGIAFIREFQAKLSAVNYREIEEKITVSIGLVYVSPECFLTEREVEERANKAKSFAKQSGKNCIAYYKGIFYLDRNLAVVK